MQRVVGWGKTVGWIRKLLSPICRAPYPETTIHPQSAEIKWGFVAGYVANKMDTVHNNNKQTT